MNRDPIAAARERLIDDRGTSATHGHAGIRHSPTYNCWVNMRQRCANPNSSSYHNYGARGVAVCARWETSFPNFLADMGEKPAGHSIDRINNNGPYSPENCRWATRLQQNHNTRTNRLISFSGETLPISAWATRVGIPRETISNRLRLGWSVDEALTSRREKQ